VTYRFLRVEVEGAATTVTLDRPEVLNAINPAMHDELQHAFDTFAADDTQFVCIVTGAGGRAFSSGSDLKAGSRESGYRYPRSGYAGLAERFDLAKPVIASVNGLALGGGFELVLACDIVIAADHASFGLVEPRVGAMALAGGVHRLVRQIGFKPAMGYLLTADRINAADALRLGLVNEVVPAVDLAAATRRWRDRILACAPLAVQATKEAALRGLDEPSLAAAISHQKDYPGFDRWWNSDDVREGVRAFGEKRAPVWKGR
jgi:enoyl-CoA hydratase/carnithine racemase